MDVQGYAKLDRKFVQRASSGNKLADWLGLQREAAHKGILDADQILILDLDFPGWRQEPARG